MQHLYMLYSYRSICDITVCLMNSSTATILESVSLQISFSTVALSVYHGVHLENILTRCWGQLTDIEQKIWKCEKIHADSKNLWKDLTFDNTANCKNDKLEHTRYAEYTLLIPKGNVVECQCTEMSLLFKHLGTTFWFCGEIHVFPAGTIFLT
jgi:hypothetical protein